MTFITQKQFTQSKKELLTNLDWIRKANLAVLKNNTKMADYYSKKHTFKTADREIVNMMFDITCELIKTRCDDDITTKSTALCPLFNRNWTIGSFGSIFVDLIVRGKQLRVSFITKSEAVKHGYNTSFFWVESLAD